MYCKNCGSILANNANFCHVCGTKVDVVDSFANEKSYSDNNNSYNPQEDPLYGWNKEPEEPKQTQEPENSFYRSYYDDYNKTHTSELTPTQTKKAFIPGLISMIGSIAIGGEAGISYLVGRLVYDEYYTSGVIDYSTYLSYCKNLLQQTGIYLILAFILGIVLGGIGLNVSIKAKSKKGFIFSIIGLVIGVVALAFSIVSFVYLGQLG